MLTEKSAQCWPVYDREQTKCPKKERLSNIFKQKNKLPWRLLLTLSPWRLLFASLHWLSHFSRLVFLKYGNGKSSKVLWFPAILLHLSPVQWQCQGKKQAPYQTLVNPCSFIHIKFHLLGAWMLPFLLDLNHTRPCIRELYEVRSKIIIHHGCEEQ